MAMITSLKKSITTISKDDALQIILSIRSSRFIPKSAARKRKASEKKTKMPEPAKLAKKLTLEQVQALMKEFGGDDEVNT